jgi:NAD+ diphosphatase
VQEIPRGEAHGPMLVVSPIMSGRAKQGRLHDLVLARSLTDRASHLRTDPIKMQELWLESKVILIIKDRVHATDSELIFHGADEFTGEGERYFLGVNNSTKESYFAWHTDEEVMGPHQVGDEELRTLRQIGAELSDEEAGLVVHAIGLSHWHSSHPRCSRCGAPTTSDFGGSVRVCEVDGSQHHPRTDPAVIVLVKDEDDRLLLGRQHSWAPGRFSNFAGFVEPGESFEQCVLREVEEESGLIVHSVDYLGSQPWPFPASIMIAFEARTSDVSTARADGEEIVEIKWFTRQTMKEAVNSGEISLPPRISVSRRMIEYWYGEGALVDLKAPV